MTTHRKPATVAARIRQQARHLELNAHCESRGRYERLWWFSPSINGKELNSAGFTDEECFEFLTRYAQTGPEVNHGLDYANGKESKYDTQLP